MTDEPAPPSRIGERFTSRRPLRLGRDAPAKMAARSITEAEVRAVLAENVIVDIVQERDRYILLGQVAGRPLIAVVADDVLDDATVLISVYEPDEEHGWTPQRIEATLRGEFGEEHA